MSNNSSKNFGQYEKARRGDQRRTAAYKQYSNLPDKCKSLPPSSAASSSYSSSGDEQTRSGAFRSPPTIKRKYFLSDRLKTPTEEQLRDDLKRYTNNINTNTYNRNTNNNNNNNNTNNNINDKVNSNERGGFNSRKQQYSISKDGAGGAPPIPNNVRNEKPTLTRENTTERNGISPNRIVGRFLARHIDANYRKEKSSSNDKLNASTRTTPKSDERNDVESHVPKYNNNNDINNNNINNNNNYKYNKHQLKQRTNVFPTDYSSKGPAESRGECKSEFNNCIYDKMLSMGQSHGKRETNSNSRFNSPRKFRESTIPEEESDSGISSPSRPQVYVPKITVVDFSGSGGGSGSANSGSGSQSNNIGNTARDLHFTYDNDSAFESNSNEEDRSESADYYLPNGKGNGNVINHEPLYGFSYNNSNYNNNGNLNMNATTSNSNNINNSNGNINGNINSNYSNLYSNNNNNNTNGSIHMNGNYNSPLNRASSYDSYNQKSPSAHSWNNNYRSSSNENRFLNDDHFNSTRFRSASPQYPANGFTDDWSSQNSEQPTMSPPLYWRPSISRNDSGIGSNGNDFLPHADSPGLFSSESQDRLICIESISLPDVVVESTNLTTLNASSPNSDDCESDQILNIDDACNNGASGNVHYIPIHVERDHDTSSSSIKKTSSMHGTSTRTNYYDGDSRPTIEIIENCTLDADHFNADKLKCELTEQKTRFESQLEEAEKNAKGLQRRIDEMHTKIQDLERELSTRTWNVEKLQTELNSLQVEDSLIRNKIKSLEEEKASLQRKFYGNEEELSRKYNELNLQYKELEGKYKTAQLLIENLQTQLTTSQSHAEKWKSEMDKIRYEFNEQTGILRNALDNSEAERKICADRWQKEFEILRTQHLDHEETLMADCEWQLRQMQKLWKDKLQKSEHAFKEALEKMELLEARSAVQNKEIEHLRVYKAEVKSLRGVITEQENSLQILVEQIETLKTELTTANEALQEQRKKVEKIKHHCDSTLRDNERQMNYKINEVRNEAAAFWEDKLYREMNRLKNELESEYIEERREALNKLANEHIEELRALTTRYTANEEDLRSELQEIQDLYSQKEEEFLELRTKSDNTLLQTRMHLDRADRDYQMAMSREEERREALRESLRKEFDLEKQTIEEEFRERLCEVKQEFARELQLTTQEMSRKHQAELDQLKLKLKAEKDEALQDLADRHQKILAAAEDQLTEMEIRHQADLKDLKATYDTEKAALDKRDLNNANEIEQLHRKCRCLTNLFEEMRMRYERRDPRPEDLREIAELRQRCESQERDLYDLTERLRETQTQLSEIQQQGSECQSPTPKVIKKPPPKTLPTSCDVIYEENEERDSSSSPTPSSQKDNNGEASNSESDDDDDDDAKEEQN